MQNGQTFRTIDIERRGYGRRYTWLPVDGLSREGCWIDFADSYITPEMIDIRAGDVVRWREGERLVQGLIASVRYEKTALHAEFEQVALLPPDAFHP